MVKKIWVGKFRWETFFLLFYFFLVSCIFNRQNMRQKKKKLIAFSKQKNISILIKHESCVSVCLIAFSEATQAHMKFWANLNHYEARFSKF